MFATINFGPIAVAGIATFLLLHAWFEYRIKRHTFVALVLGVCGVVAGICVLFC
jgi:lysylphosphatidylglycerol synthetase-like protein (DUF2156 family)